MKGTVELGQVETEGNEVSTSFQEDAAVRLWLGILERSGVDDKVLAAECRMSKGHFSKVSSGQQGNLLALVLRVGRRRPTLRRAFIDGLAALEQADPLAAAAEALAVASARYLRLRAERFPARVQAKAALREASRAAVNE